MIYRRHHDAVHRLARRFAKHTSEADDVTSEVFAKTLRAIVHGHGPSDDAGPYLLRSVRNTVTSLRIGGDARTVLTADDHLDRPGPQTSPRCDDDDVSLAFLDLPDRYRDVLWATVVEGRGPADIADGSIDAGAVASLTHRARFALRRSYLVSSTRRRCAVDTCREIRQLMPGAVFGQAAASTCGRIDDHALTCSECADVRGDMERLAQQMPARSLLGLLGAWWARLGSSAAQLAGSTAPIVAPAIAATVGVAATMMAASSHEIDRPADTAGPAIELTEPLGGLGSDAVTTVELDGLDSAAPTRAGSVNDQIAPVAVSDLAEPSGALDAAPSPTGAKSGHRSVPRDATVGIGGVAPTGTTSTGGAQAVDPVNLDGHTVDELVGTAPTGDPDDPVIVLPGIFGSEGVGAVDDLVGSGGVGGLVGGVVGGAVNGLAEDVVQPVLAGTDQVVGAVTGTPDEIGRTTLDEVVAPVDGAVDSTVDTTLETVDEVVAPVDGAVDSATEPVSGPTGDTLDAVTESLTGLLGH